jgi:hypothetical protein
MCEPDSERPHKDISCTGCVDRIHMHRWNLEHATIVTQKCSPGPECYHHRFYAPCEECRYGTIVIGETRHTRKQ